MGARGEECGVMTVVVGIGMALSEMNSRTCDGGRCVQGTNVKQTSTGRFDFTKIHCLHSNSHQVQTVIASLSRHMNA